MAVLNAVSANVGGDLETRANFDNRGRGPSHGLLRWIVQKRCRIYASGPLAGGARPFARQVEADQQGPSGSGMKAAERFICSLRCAQAKEGFGSSDLPIPLCHASERGAGSRVCTEGQA
jgi:hypothetical protein